MLNFGNIPSLSSIDSNISAGKLDWSNLTHFSDRHPVGCIELPKVATVCCDMNCKNLQHSNELSFMYDSIVESLLISSRPFYKHKSNVYHAKLGWNDKGFMLRLEGLLKHG